MSGVGSACMSRCMECLTEKPKHQKWWAFTLLCFFNPLCEELHFDGITSSYLWARLEMKSIFKPLILAKKSPYENMVVCLWQCMAHLNWSFIVLSTLFLYWGVAVAWGTCVFLLCVFRTSPAAGIRPSLRLLPFPYMQVSMKKLGLIHIQGPNAVQTV